MLKTATKIVLQALAMTAGAAVLGAATNLARPDGIPLVTDVPYDIFAPCRDSEASSEAVTEGDFGDAANALYVDARPADLYAAEHARGAVNVPYSALFGAEDKDIARVADTLSEKGYSTVIVYGEYTDPAAPGTVVDFGKPLAEQLVETGIAGVKHIKGGLGALKKNGVETVQGSGGTR